MLSRPVFVHIVCALLPAGVSADAKGIVDYYGPQETCMNCHLPAAMRKGAIELTSPAYLGETYTFSFTCKDTTGAGGTLPVAGLNVFASCGTLSPAEPGTKVVGKQLVHSQPGKTTLNAKTWTFAWTAPTAPTSCGFNITGLLGDDDKKETGDVTCMAMKALLVVPRPDAGPPDLALLKDAVAPDGSYLADAAAGNAEGGAASDHRGGDLGDGAAAGDGCGCGLHNPASSPLTLLALFLSLALFRRFTLRRP